MYLKWENSLRQIRYMLFFDLVCMAVSFCLAIIIRHGTLLSGQSIYPMTMLILLLTRFCIAYGSASGAEILKRGFYLEFMDVLKMNTIMMGVGLAFLFFTKQSTEYSRLVYFYFFLINLVITYLARIVLKRKFLLHFKRSPVSQKIMVITTSDRAQGVLEKLKEEAGWTYEITSLALLDKDLTGQAFENVRVVADRSTLFSYAGAEVLDAVFFSVDYTYPGLQDLIDRFQEMGVLVYLNMENLELDLPNKNIDQVGGFTVMVSGSKVVSPFQAVVKRGMDIAGAAAGLLVTAVLYVFLAPAIKLESPGPVFFSQERVGKNGRRFRIYKFRSMYVDAEKKKQELKEHNQMQGLMFKMEDDPRITRVGRFIRKTSLDEFPQFYNVLKGDMSLVGTRPPTVDEFERYDPHHRRRLSIKPGLTGIWQTSGRSEVTDFEEVVKMDTEYIDRWSLGMDVKLIAKTVVTVLAGRGSM